MVIIPKFRGHCIGFPSAASWKPDYGDSVMFGGPFEQYCHHLDTLLHSLFPSPVAVHAGIGGGGRNSSIRCRISRNSFLGTATSANWKVT